MSEEKPENITRRTLGEILDQHQLWLSSEGREGKRADLVGAKGLAGSQLARADLTHVRLPEEINWLEELKNVDEASQHSRKLFFTMLLGAVYSLITIAGTTDIKLLTNSAGSPLPIIGTGIPLVGFYWLAPVFMLSIFVYFHLYLQRQWEKITEFPAVFPDGIPVDKKVYPWLFNGLVRDNFRRLRNDKPPMFILQKGMSIMLGWVMVPAVLIFFWMRYLSRHNWSGTILHIALITGSCWLAIYFYNLTVSTLRGLKEKDGLFIMPTGFSLGTGLLLFVLSYGAITGVNPDIYSEVTATYQEANIIQQSVPKLFYRPKSLVKPPFADFSKLNVSVKPGTFM
ncbi:MAG: hypothetical protein ACE5GM_09425, partial [bacterium]